MSRERAERFETFVTWYLRSNGYFTIPSFVIHAGDDPTRISGDIIGNLTEVDTLAIRLPYSRESSGTDFPLDKNLVDGADGRFDVILAEAKSGKSDSPNKIWRTSDTAHVEYLLRFLGWHKEDDKIESVAKVLNEHYCYEETMLRVRYIIFAEDVDLTWSKRGVKYIRFDDCITFISEARGRCWENAGIGRRSMHDQWSPLIKRIFEIANNGSLSASCRQKYIRKILDKG